MSYGTFEKSIGSLEFTADRLMDVLEESETTTAMEMEPRHIDEARHLLYSSELEFERLTEMEHHEPKDYHVWAIKKREHEDEVANELTHDRDVLKDSSDELEKSLHQLERLREHVLGVQQAYVDYADRMMEASKEVEGEQLSADYSSGMVQREVMPEIDKMLRELESLIETYKKELEVQLDQLDFLGRQIAWLRGGPLPVRPPMGEDEPVEEDDRAEDGPTQAEALIESQMEQLEGLSVDDLDRGRKDERQKKRGPRGRGGGK